jgi:2-polyprenyl-6-methoxyphenol hydroxylase-like FAD-dependent oxidoreductase
VTATFSDGTRVRAGYVVGADGMHSTVREQAGIGFTGGTYEESFALADVRVSGGVPDDEVILYFSPAGLVVVAPLPGGIHRIVATVKDAPHQPDGASPDLLDTYTATRRPVAQQVVSLADRLTRLATINPRLRPVRNLVLGLLARSPAFRRQLARRLSGLVYR